MTLRNSFDWPLKSPLAIKPWIAATAPANLSDKGRIAEQRGRSGLMNSAGTGKMRLGWMSGLSGENRFGNVRPSLLTAFHFGSIEEGGTSLYAAMSQKVSHPEVLRITLGIGGDEIAHFLEWVAPLRPTNAVSQCHPS